MFERRLRLVLVAGFLFFGVIAVRLFTMQVLDADYWREESARLSTNRIILPARRGRIFDRAGQVLAEDRLEWDLALRFDHLDGSAWICASCERPAIRTTADPPRRCPGCGGGDFIERPPPDFDRLAGLLGIAPSEFAAWIESVRAERGERVEAEVARLLRDTGRVRRKEAEERFRGWQWVVAEDVSEALVRELSLHPERYRGFLLRSTYRRFRVDDEDLARLVGSVSGVYRKELAAYRAEGLSLSQIYRLTVGRSGLERAFEAELRARDGSRLVDRNPDGSVRGVLDLVPVRDGEDVHLSLDAKLTTLVADALERQCRRLGARGGGAFVAIEPTTGEVLVLADHTPAPSSHLAVTPTVPGSVFKTVTAIAGLEVEGLDPTRRFLCEGKWHGIHCHGSTHGYVDLEDAIAESCNGYFAELAGELTIDPLADWARRLGFGRPTRLSLPGETGGTVPDPEWKAWDAARRSTPEQPVDDKWYRGETWQVGIGQGALMVTPVQVARLMAIVANGGRDLRTTLVVGGGGLGERLFGERTLGPLRAGLRAAFTRGTAERTGLARFGAAGKTGTADLPAKKGQRARNNAWLAGYAPADAPRIAFACYIGDVDEYGADAAGPVVERFFEEYFAE